jgi:hypothetical protein
MYIGDTTLRPQAKREIREGDVVYPWVNNATLSGTHLATHPLLVEARTIVVWMMFNASPEKR